jgi:hypothetical protein
MRCYECGGPTKVTNTRHADSKESTSPSLIRQARDTVAWYTADWVARMRHCPKCAVTTNTIEIPIADLSEGWAPKDS